MYLLGDYLYVLAGQVTEGNLLIERLPAKGFGKSCIRILLMPFSGRLCHRKSFNPNYLGNYLSLLRTFDLLICLDTMGTHF